MRFSYADKTSSVKSLELRQIQYKLEFRFFSKFLGQMKTTFFKLLLC
jgi:hypothetical protein